MIDWKKVFSKDAYEFKITDVDAEVTPEFVRNLRNRLNLSQRMFAKILGLSEKTIEKWEQGATEVKRTASRLLYILDKQPELLDELYMVKREDEIMEYYPGYTTKVRKVKKSENACENDMIKYIPGKNTEEDLIEIESRSVDRKENIGYRYI